jgi:hypothetical protein
MIALLQWTTLVVCALIAVARIPSALRGQNRSVFGIFVLATLAVLLSIDVSYRTIDAWLGSENYTNLVLRFLVYGTVLLAGYRVAKAFDAPTSVRLITGPAGKAALAVTGVATVVLFLLADTAGSATGLSGLPLRSPENASLIYWYAAAGRLYPAFVAVCILPATFLAIRRRLPWAIRAGAALLTVAFAALAAGALFPLIPPEANYLRALINYTAVLSLALGLAFVWISSLLARRAGRSGPR